MVCPRHVAAFVLSLGWTGRALRQNTGELEGPNFAPVYSKGTTYICTAKWEKTGDKPTGKFCLLDLASVLAIHDDAVQGAGSARAPRPSTSFLQQCQAVATPHRMKVCGIKGKVGQRRLSYGNRERWPKACFQPSGTVMVGRSTRTRKEVHIPLLETVLSRQDCLVDMASAEPAMQDRWGEAYVPANESNPLQEPSEHPAGSNPLHEEPEPASGPVDEELAESSEDEDELLAAPVQSSDSEGELADVKSDSERENANVKPPLSPVLAEAVDEGDVGVQELKTDFEAIRSLWKQREADTNAARAARAARGPKK